MNSNIIYRLMDMSFSTFSIINNANINILTRLQVYMCKHFPGHIPRNEILRYNKCLLSTLLEMPNFVPQWLFYLHLYCQHMKVLVLCVCVCVCVCACVCVLNICQPDGYEVVSFCGFLWHVWISFLIFIVHSSFLINFLFKPFVDFCIEVSFSYL